MFCGCGGKKKKKKKSKDKDKDRQPKSSEEDEPYTKSNGHKVMHRVSIVMVTMSLIPLLKIASRR